MITKLRNIPMPVLTPMLDIMQENDWRMVQDHDHELSFQIIEGQELKNSKTSEYVISPDDGEFNHVKMSLVFTTVGDCVVECEFKAVTEDGVSVETTHE